MTDRTFEYECDEGGSYLICRDLDEGQTVRIRVGFREAEELLEAVKPIAAWVDEAYSAKASYIPRSYIEDALESGVYDDNAGKRIGTERELERRSDG